MLERDDGISVPVPPGAVTVALCRFTDRAIGVVTGWFDAQGRQLPDGSCLATHLTCWDGAWLSLPDRWAVRTTWHLGGADVR